MLNSLLPVILRELEENQSSKRFRHSLAVGELAAKLGKKHGWDPDRARMAGLLHDFAKEWRPRKLIQYVKKRKLRVPSYKFVVNTSPNHLHAYVSADVVRRKGWIRHASDIKAIAAHTFGAIPMGREQKILYIADLASTDRRYKEAAWIRRQAFKDLTLGFQYAVATKMAFNVRKRKTLHPQTINLWNKVVCGA